MNETQENCVWNKTHLDDLREVVPGYDEWSRRK